MKHRPPILGSGLLALAAALAAVPALAGDDCEVPISRWQSREALGQMAAQNGWAVQRLKIDDGCYEIRGIDAAGRGFKARIDPETLEVIKLKRRDRKAARKHEGERVHEPGPSADTTARDAPPVSPLFTPGTAPRGQVE